MKLTERGWAALVALAVLLAFLIGLFLHGPYDSAAKHGVIVAGGNKWI